MNKSYRILWSESRGAFIVAHEKTSAHGKPSSTRTAIVQALATAFLSVGSCAAWAACPGVVSNGELITSTCVMTDASSLDINTTTNPTGTGIKPSNPQNMAVSVGSGVTVNYIRNNGGVIEGNSADGISVGVGGTISGGITNTGIIYGDVNLLGTAGIRVDSGRVGGITNSGTGSLIQGNNTGILVIATSGDATIAGNITNEGMVSRLVVDDGHSGYRSVVTGNISNSGTISDGLVLYDSSVDGRIQNSGEISRITVANEVSIAQGITNSGVISGANVGIDMSDSGTTVSGITNQSGGTISGENQGISVSSNASLGSIINQSGGTISGFSSGIGVNSQASVGSITNSGLISSNMVGINSNHGNINEVINDSGSTISGINYGILLTNDATVGSITNGGVISGDDYGIYVAASSVTGIISNHSGATISVGTWGTGIALSSSATVGGISNSGTISGGRYGIVVMSSSSVEGSIINQSGGTISGDRRGIAVTWQSSVSGITNSGMISSQNCDSSWVGCAGIYMTSSALTGGIHNQSGGTIQALLGTSGLASGIFVKDSTISGGITNSGLISSANQNGIMVIGGEGGGSLIDGGITNSGTILGGTTNCGSSECAGIYIENSTINDGISNSAAGVISGAWVGLNIWDGAIVTGGITNSGLISGEEYSGVNIDFASISGDIVNTAGAALMSSNDAALNYNNAVQTGNVINHGLLDGAGTGIWIDSTSIYGGITNTGTILGGASGGINMHSQSTVTGDLINTGLISGRGHTGITITDTSTLSGGITNSGTISGSTAIYSDASSTLPTILNQSGGLIDGTLTVLSNTNLTNAGTIALAETSHSTIAGDFTQTSTGVLEIGASSDTSYSTLTIGGAASLAGSAYVNVASLNTLLVGQTLSGVIDAGSVAGNFASVGDNSALVNFTSHVNGTQVDFYVIPGLTVESSALEWGNSPSLPAAVVLDQIRDITPAGMEGVVTKLNELSTTSEVSSAASQTLPLLVGSSIATIEGGLAAINKVIQSRNEGNIGISSGDTFYGDRHVWMKPFGSRITQSDQGAMSGYKSDLAGLAFGVDGTISDHARVGLSLAYANAHVSGNASDAPNSANNDLYALIGYGSYSLDAGVEAFWQADVGNVRNRGKRDILFMETTASSSFSTRTYHLGGGIAKSYSLSELTAFTPSARIDYTHLRDSSYTETGAGALNLSVDARTSEALVYSVDGKFARKIGDSSTLLANFGVGYDANAKASKVVAAYAGASDLSFTTSGIDPTPWLLRGGFGWLTQLKDGPEITARYDIEHREGFNNQSASVKLRWSF